MLLEGAGNIELISNFNFQLKRENGVGVRASKAIR
jgi:hypothetical protein